MFEKKNSTTNHTNTTNFLNISCRCSCWFVVKNIRSMYEK